MTDKSVTVGVLGGMGPLGTLDFLERLITLTPAEEDIDHIRTIVDNNPKVPSRIEYFINKRGENPGPAIADMARGLEAQLADFLVMPCNTAHLLCSEIESAVSIPLINMIEVTADRLKSDRIKAPGILASTAVHQTKLYKTALEERQIISVVPDESDQSCLMNIITAVKAGHTTFAMQNELLGIAARLKDSGADCLIIACTELSAISSDLKTDRPIVDAAQCLAETTVEMALGRKSIG